VRRYSISSNEQTSELEPGCLDAFLQIPLIDYVKSARPRVLFVGYGETDWWAHIGHYDLVLESAHHMDAYVRELWETMQALPEYRGRRRSSSHAITPRQRARGVEGARRFQHGSRTYGSR